MAGVGQGGILKREAEVVSPRGNTVQAPQLRIAPVLVQDALCVCACVCVSPAQR